MTYHYYIPDWDEAVRYRIDEGFILYYDTDFDDTWDESGYSLYDVLSGILYGDLTHTEEDVNYA